MIAARSALRCAHWCDFGSVFKIRNVAQTEQRIKPMNKHPPTAKQFSAYMDEHGLTLRIVYEMVRTSKRTVNNWKSGVHEMPYTAWCTLRTKVEGEPPE